jgi:hypothetical protein
MISLELKNACCSLLNIYAMACENSVNCVVYIHSFSNRRKVALACESIKTTQDYPDAMVFKGSSSTKEGVVRFIFHIVVWTVLVFSLSQAT